MHLFFSLNMIYHKTTNIINSINAIVIPNLEETFPDSKNTVDFIDN